jgi:hypothetical protein
MCKENYQTLQASLNQVRKMLYGRVVQGKNNN